MLGLEINESITYFLLFIALYSEVFLLVSFLERRAEKSRPLFGISETGALPRVAIVIPCFNEERTLASTVESVLALQYPSELLETIIIDDGSTDGTLAIAKRFGGVGGVRVFCKQNGGKHTALNIALEKTDADLIGCLDANSTVEPSALMRIVRAFENPSVSAVTPGIHVKKPETALQHIQNVEYNLSVFNRFILSVLGSAFITPGPFSIFRTKTVRALGGWRHGHSTEDMEMALRMQAGGHLIANAPSAAVHTSVPRTLPELFHQRVRWTYGFLRNALDYRFMFGNRAFGNLGLLILPAAFISIGAGIYFFVHILWYWATTFYDAVLNVQVTGVLPRLSFELFYINTSTLWFLVYAAVALILVLICTGSWLGTGKRVPPAGTPLFILLYSFLTPLWLGTALVRALFKTGVEWR